MPRIFLSRNFESGREGNTNRSRCRRVFCVSPRAVLQRSRTSVLPFLRRLRSISHLFFPFLPIYSKPIASNLNKHVTRTRKGCRGTGHRISLQDPRGTLSWKWPAKLCGLLLTRCVTSLYLKVGDIGTGKTAIIRRCVENQFSESYKTTIGVDFALKTIQRSNATIHLQLWCASSPLPPLLFPNRF